MSICTPGFSEMKLLVSEIPKEGIDVDVRETLAAEDTLVALQGKLRVVKTGSEVMVGGNLNAAVGLQCSRCLKKFTADMLIPVDVVYHPIAEVAEDGNHEITFGELDLDFYSGDELDISRLLSEQVALNIPMKPLCDDLCKGLCHACGTDLNLSSCSCSLKNTDVRFQELKKLLKERKE